MRPTTIKVIGIIAVIISLVLIFGAIIEIIVFLKIGPEILNDEFQTPEFEEFKNNWAKIFEFIFENLHIVASLQLLTGLGLLTTASAFYRLKKGAERLLFRLSLVTYSFFSFITIWWLIFWFNLIDLSSDPRSPTFFDYFIGPILVILANTCAIWALIELRRHLKSSIVLSSLNR